MASLGMGKVLPPIVCLVWIIARECVREEQLRVAFALDTNLEALRIGGRS